MRLLRALAKQWVLFAFKRIFLTKRAVFLFVRRAGLTLAWLAAVNGNTPMANPGARINRLRLSEGIRVP